jgi:hypothetical protein
MPSCCKFTSKSVGGMYVFLKRFSLWAVLVLAVMQKGHKVNNPSAELLEMKNVVSTVETQLVA